MKKITLLFLAIVLALTAFSLPTFAATYTEYDIYVQKYSEEANGAYYHNAKFEPQTGSYLAMYAEGDTQFHNWNLSSDNWYFTKVPQLTGKQHAAYMVYVKYASADAISHYASHYREAAKMGKAIQVCIEPANGLDEVKNDEHLVSLAKQANDTGIPLFIRFASEFNDSSNAWHKDGTAKYIEKFRLVANVFHKYAPNVAMVWTANDWPLETVDSYYPGDAYVDWVGVSSYPIYLADGTPKQGNTWIDRFRSIYDTYGSRKPIMISEGAPSSTVEYHTEQNVTDSAQYEILRFYAGAARRYPNLKMIMYWSNNESWARQIHCSLGANSALMNAYKTAIKDDYYLGNMNTSSNIFYSKVSATHLRPVKEKISGYANNASQRISSCNYYINGKYAATGSFPTYEVSIDFSTYAGQNITLRADFYSSAGKYVSGKTVNVNVEKAITVYFDGKKLNTEVSPIIINGTTMVPLRFISDSFDADIQWNASTKTATVTKGEKSIKLTIGNKTATINGSSKNLDVAPILQNDQTFVPLRVILEAFGATVTWNNANYIISITSSGKTPVPIPTPTVSFNDVKTTDYFYKPVNWAVANNVTTGVGNNNFAPSQTCTRGQTVTFLWRAAGCPEPTGSNNPFTDVKSSDYFYKAVLWAVGKNVTTGTSNTTFSPNQGCTRGQVVTFLWRANGQPGVSANNPFNDVVSGQYYYTAVLWAVNKNITKGTTTTTFSPNATCIRGQIVTFLYRNYN